MREKKTIVILVLLFTVTIIVITYGIITRTSNANTLIYNLLLPTETRTLIPIQMKLPNGQWSQPIKFNFDTGASFATDIPLELLADFGSGPDGVPSDQRHEQPVIIKIVGLNGEYKIPCMIQDKDHYDLFRSQSNRYPLLRIRDITDRISIVYTNTQTILRVGSAPPSELMSVGSSNTINLPDMALRDGTPTSGWQWMQVKFSNPSSHANITDWFGLNTGDVRIVMKKSLGDSLQLPLIDGRDSDNFNSHATMEFIESMPTHAILANIPIEVRRDTADFARGGPARNFGSGLVVLDRYSIVVWGGLHWALIPASAQKSH
jgi:hypothetical protein